MMKHPLCSRQCSGTSEISGIYANFCSESEVLIVRERNRVNHAAVQDKWSDPYAITVTDIRVGECTVGTFQNVLLTVGDKTVMIRECKSPTAFFGQSAVQKLVESTMSAEGSADDSASKSSTASSPLNGTNAVH